MTENVPVSPNKKPTANDEIDLGKLLGVLLANAWLIIGAAVVAGVAALAVSLLLPNIYRSEALLAPAEMSNSGLAGMMQKYSGLASLAGVTLPSEGGISRTVLGIEVMRSRSFVAQFIEQRDILVPLMATESWNRKRGELEIDADIYDVAQKKWTREVSPPKVAKPSEQEAYQAWRSIFSVNVDKQTGFVRLAVEHKSPVIAKQWADWVVEDLNDWIRAQDIEESKRAIEYLGEQISKTSLADLRTAFSELMQQQMQTLMLAEVRKEYVFKTVDPATVPEDKIRPRRSILILISMFLAVVVVTAGVLIRHRASLLAP